MPSERPTRVLLADADGRSRSALARVLRKDGLEVLEVKEGAEAVETFQTAKPDVVVLDAAKPRSYGLEACALIREMEGGRNLPILVITRPNDTEAADRAFEAGATDFSTKPIATRMLRQRIRFLLRTAEATEALIRSDARLEAAQRIARLGTWEIAEGEENVVLSAQAARLLGLEEDLDRLPLEEFLGRLEEDSRRFFADEIVRARKEGGSLRCDGRLVLPEGRERAVHVQAETVPGREGVPLLAGTIQDVTEHEEARDEIRMLAYYDGLTGLPNRALFNETLQGALARARRRQGMLAVLFVDLDHFKRINDTMGHSAGDKLLEAVARRLRDVVRTEDVVSRPETEEASEVARLGGDEFILLAADLELPEDAAHVARRILEALRSPVPLPGGEVFVSASVGISIFPQDGDDVEELFKNADAALYHAKDSGRNNYQFYSPRLNAAALERLNLERSLRVALENGEFVLHYQPQVAAREGRVVGVEALVRWQHPEMGLFAPEQFIGVAEETGLIQGIGEFVLREACSQLQAWAAAGLPEVRMAVNISGRQFRDPGFLASVRAALREGGVPPDRVEIEITESVLMEEASAAVGILESLASEGVRVAIDDFGSGYSSLAYLKRFPIHALKIDRSFIRDIATDSDDAAIVTAVVALGHALDLEVIAEGVETPVQREYLHEHDCDLMQGYIFGKPMPSEEMEELLRAQTDPGVTRRRKPA
jgi:diguanylate cyclase (GGDEF)-like protein